MRASIEAFLVSLFLVALEAVAYAGGAGALQFSVSFEREACRMAPTAGGPPEKICPARHLVAFANSSDAPIDVKIFCGNSGHELSLQQRFRLGARQRRTQSVAEYDYPTYRASCFIVTDEGRANLF